MAPATQPAPGERREVVIRIAGGKVSPKPGRVEVERGARVELRVTSDVADELHVHGYDKSAQLKPGKAATVAFTADRSGLFQVETHSAHLVLTQLLVR
ncbi:hypothetical protein [Streptomyces coryli]|uniref:hypothetical protein n=1 Tax=Streptomyces coryli TaxID=1128680 RepID=UPI001F0E882B|nr:hypothetical protein [Streptomyces coryli]